jgi:hypothetical protein
MKRNRKFVDSLLEGTGFELPVRECDESGFAIAVAAREELKVCRLPAGGDWIRTISSARADSDVRIVDYRVEAVELVDLVANCSRPTDGGEVPRTAPRAPAAVARILPPRARPSMRCQTQRR